MRETNKVRVLNWFAYWVRFYALVDRNKGVICGGDDSWIVKDQRFGCERTFVMDF